jgi:phage-related protein
MLSGLWNKWMITIEPLCEIQFLIQEITTVLILLLSAVIAAVAFFDPPTPRQP